MKSIYKLIKLNRIIRSHRLKYLGVLVADILGMRHLFIRLDPVNACNLKCSMCYFSDREYAKKIRGRFSSEDLNRIAGLLFPNTLQLVIGCAAEPTLYKNYIDLVLLAKKYHVPFVGLTTNGQLIDEDQVRALVSSGLDEITLSLHGVVRDSYEDFMVNADYSKFHELLSHLTTWKSRSGHHRPDVRINYTVNANNLPELKDFFKHFGEYSINTLQIRPMVDVGHTSFPHQPMSTSTRDQYNDIIRSLQAECKDRGIVLLATKDDPNFTSYDKGTSYILPAVLRTVHPNKVWMPDFDWREESYREFCKRIGWRTILLGTIIGRKDHFKKVNHYLTYDVE